MSRDINLGEFIIVFTIIPLSLILGAFILFMSRGIILYHSAYLMIGEDKTIRKSLHDVMTEYWRPILKYSILTAVYSGTSAAANSGERSFKQRDRFKKTNTKSGMAFGIGMSYILPVILFHNKKELKVQIIKSLNVFRETAAINMGILSYGIILLSIAMIPISTALILVFVLFENIGHNMIAVLILLGTYMGAFLIFVILFSTISNISKIALYINHEYGNTVNFKIPEYEEDTTDLLPDKVKEWLEEHQGEKPHKTAEDLGINNQNKKTNKFPDEDESSNSE